MPPARGPFGPLFRARHLLVLLFMAALPGLMINSEITRSKSDVRFAEHDHITAETSVVFGREAQRLSKEEFCMAAAKDCGLNPVGSMTRRIRRGGNTTASTNGKPKLLLGALLSNLRPNHPALLGYEAARQLLLPQALNTELSMLTLDDKGRIHTGIYATENLTRLDAVGFVGATISIVSELVQILASAAGLTQVSCCSTSSRLSAKERYPSFTRTITEDATVFHLLAQAVKKYGWRHVGVFRTDDPFGEDAANTFLEAADGLNIKVEFNEQLFYAGRMKFVAEQRVIKAVETAKSKNVRIFVVCMLADDARMLLEKAFEEGLVGEGYVWLGTNGWADNSLFAGWPIAAAHPYAFQGILSGMAACNPHTDAFNLLAGWLQRTGNVSSPDSINAFTCYAFDSVALMARAVDGALARVLKINTEYGTTISPDCLQPNYFEDNRDACMIPEAVRNQLATLAACGEVNCTQCGICEMLDKDGARFARSPQMLVLEQVYSQTFTGASGEIRLDKNGDRQSNSATYGFFSSVRLMDGDGSGPSHTFKRLGYVSTTNLSAFDFINRTIFAGSDANPENMVIPSDGFPDPTVATLPLGATIGIAVGAAICLSAVVAGVLVYYYKHKKTREPTVEEMVQRIQKYHKWTDANTEEAWTALYGISKTKGLIPFSQITLLNKLGSGAFGKVYRGVVFVDKCAVVVAIKSLKRHDEAAKEEFLREAEILKSLDHPNIVRTFGLSVDGQADPETGVPPIYLLLEYCDMGDLVHYVKKHAGKLSLGAQLWFSLETASALSYLASRQIIHRDVAARNVLLASPRGNGYPTAKLSDMGLARLAGKNNAYVKASSDGLLPIRWMAPESIWENKYTEASDVYSYAILVWEVFSDGALPFDFLESANQIAQAITQYGMRPPQPKSCPAEVYDLLQLCWEKVPENRPPFAFVAEKVKELFEHYDRGHHIPRTPQSVLAISREPSSHSNHTYVAMCDPMCDPREVQSTKMKSIGSPTQGTHGPPTVGLETQCIEVPSGDAPPPPITNHLIPPGSLPSTGHLQGSNTWTPAPRRSPMIASLQAFKCDAAACWS